MSKRGFAKRSLLLLFAIVLVAVSQSSLADLTDASWTVRRVGSDVEIVNMNKASFRKYAFHRASGMLKCIGWNVRQPEKFYVNDSSFGIAYPISRDYEIGDCGQEVYKIGLSRRQDDGLVSLFFRSRVCAEDKKRKKMKVAVRSRGNALSPAHDRLLTLSASLGEPDKRSDGSFAYSFNFSIPLYAPRWWQFWL